MEAQYLTRGLLIGLFIAAQVGPMSILCIRRTLEQGRLAGLVSGLGVASADGLYGAVGGLGLTVISSFLINQQFWLRLGGGLFLCYLGFKAWNSPPASQAARALERTSLAGMYLSTLLLTLTNPLTIISFGAILAGLGLDATGGNYLPALLLIGGIFTGSALWWLILTTAVSLLRHKLTPSLLQWINRGSGLLIAGFGLSTLVSLIASF